MATVMAIEPKSTQMPPLPCYRFTVAQYHSMIETGVLTENDRVELLEGWILPKMAHKPPHDGTISLLQTELLARVPSDWVVRIQSAITTRESEPEPDVVVARGPARRYMRSHPHPKDIALLVEVADTTLAYDRGFKGRLFARARMPVYWIVNLVDSTVEVYTQPKAGKAAAYQHRQDYGPKDALPLILAGQQVGMVPVREILP